MNNTQRYFGSAMLYVAALAFSTACLAQSPFDGTWRLNMAQAKLSTKPNVFYISQDWYHCLSCNPVVEVKADGTDQAVIGQAYDTVNVKVIDDKTIATVIKKAGKVMVEQTRTVSADGKTLTVKTTSHRLSSDQTVTAETTARLVGIAPSGVHATSGSWQIEKVKESDNGLTFALKGSADGLAYSDPTGESYTAKFDGSDAPVAGAYNYNTVSLKKVKPNTVEASYKRDAKLVEVETLTVNGRSMTRVTDNKITGRTNSYTATRQ